MSKSNSIVKLSRENKIPSTLTVNFPSKDEANKFRESLIKIAQKENINLQDVLLKSATNENIVELNCSKGRGLPGVYKALGGEYAINFGKKSLAEIFYETFDVKLVWASFIDNTALYIIPESFANETSVNYDFNAIQNSLTDIAKFEACLTGDNSNL